MRSARLRMPLIILAALGALLFSVQFVLADDTSCPAGARPATADDSAVQNGVLKVGQCYNPSDIGVTQTAEQAKQYLNSIPKRCVGKCAAPPDASHINALNDSFAVCAAQFFKAYTQRYGQVYISSAFRCGPNSASSITCNRKENANAGGATGSEHQLGLAIDVSPANGDFQTIWNFAKANPQFGVCFPYLGGDRPHMGFAGTGTGEATKCAGQGVVRACSGAPTFDVKSVPAGAKFVTSSDESGSYYGGTGCIANTTSVLYTSNNCALAPYSSALSSPVITPTPAITTTPTQTTGTTGTTPTQSTPQICNPTYTCSNNTMYYQTTSCTTQVYQLCVYGCDGNACKTSSTTSAVGNIGNLFSSTSVGTSTGNNNNNNSNSNTTNISDILKSLTTGDMFTATDVGTSVPLTLHVGTTTANDASKPSKAPIGTLVAPGTIQTYQPVGSQSTFQTQDLANVPGYTPTQNSFVFSILDGMKNALLNALNFLRSLAVR